MFRTYKEPKRVFEVSKGRGQYERHTLGTFTTLAKALKVAEKNGADLASGMGIGTVTYDVPADGSVYIVIDECHA